MLTFKLFLIFVLWKLSLGHELQNFNEIITSLDEMKSKNPECVQISLQNIVEKCKEGPESLNTLERKYSALELTLCEMSNLNISPPYGCENMMLEAEYDLCILSIEKVPQYWTTFNGNYREIGKICYELSLPYEKQQIIKLYTNITKAFQRLHQQVEISLEDNEFRQRGLEIKLANMMEMANIITSKLVTVQNDMMNEMKESAVDLQNTFENSMNLLNSFNITAGMDIKEIAVNLNFLNLELSDIFQRVVESGIQDSIANLHESVHDQCDEIRDIVSDVIVDVKDKFSEFDRTMEGLGKKEMALHEDLIVNEDLAKRIGQLLNDIESNALQRLDTLEVNNHNINNFLDDIFQGLHELFLDTEGKMDTLIDRIDTKATRVLKIMDEANEKVDYLLRYVNVGTKIVSLMNQWMTDKLQMISLIFTTGLNHCSEVLQYITKGGDLIVKSGLFICLCSMIYLRTLNNTSKPKRLRPLRYKPPTKPKRKNILLVIITSYIIIISIMIVYPHFVSKKPLTNVDMTQK